MVMVVAALLAMVAYPSYTDHVKKARRMDAMDALLYVQHLQERWRASHPSYSGSLADIGYPAEGSTGGHYDIVIADDPEPSSVAFRATATARAESSQATDSPCVTMSISVDARNPRGLKEPVDCWRR